MAWEIKWTQTAVDDLEKAADYLSKDSPRYASIFIREMMEASRSLAQLAGRGRKVPEARDSNIRELFVMNYRLLYQLSPRVVFILGFIHGSRDLWTLWKTERRKRK